MNETVATDERPGFVRLIGVLCLLGGCGKFLWAIVAAFLAGKSSATLSLFFGLEEIGSALVLIAMGWGCMRFRHWARGLLISLGLICLPELISNIIMMAVSAGQSQKIPGPYGSFAITFAFCYLAAKVAMLAFIVSALLSKQVHATFVSRNQKPDWSNRFQFAPLVILVWSFSIAYGKASRFAFGCVLPVNVGSIMGPWWQVHEICVLLLGILGAAWVIQGHLRQTWWLLVGAAILSLAYCFTPGFLPRFSNLQSLMDQFMRSAGMAQKEAEHIAQRYSDAIGIVAGMPLRVSEVLNIGICTGFLVLTRMQFLRGRGKGGASGGSERPPTLGLRSNRETTNLRKILHFIACASLCLILVYPVEKSILKRSAITRLTVEFDVDRLPSSADRDSATTQAAEIIKRRLTQYLQSAHVFERDGRNRLRIEVRGVDDLEKLKTVISRPGVLEFRLIDDSPFAQKALSHIGEEANSAEPIPAGDTLLREKDGTPYLVRGKTPLTGSDLKSAASMPDGAAGQRGVSVQFNSHGADILEKVTAANVGKRMALVLDGLVYTAPRIKGPIKQGSLIIDGQFSREEVRDLAVVLGSGPLPVPVKTISKVQQFPID
ncbi:MAG: hypothetical protein NTY77_18740 [Elusimicrobia bacterium]|nr:hypothetical protein [Elusimicrobiota bacterium]